MMKKYKKLLRRNLRNGVIGSLVYGFFIVNFLDNAFNPSIVHGWHFFLILIYLAFPLLISRTLWELAEYFTIISLTNDLTYAPFRNLFLNGSYDLLKWYMFQLGFKGLDPTWTADFFFFKIRVCSLLMGLSIYVRFTILFLVFNRVSQKSSQKH